MSGYSESEKGEIKADLEAIYRAGRLEMPRRATDLTVVGTAMSACIDAVNVASAQMGDYGVTTDALSLMAECQLGVSRAVTTLNNIAATVVAVADDFVARDDYATEVFNSLNKDLKSGEVPVVPPPPGPGESDPAAPGAGPDVPPNPDAADPESDRTQRHDDYEDRQDDVPKPRR